MVQYFVALLRALLEKLVFPTIGANLSTDIIVMGVFAAPATIAARAYFRLTQGRTAARLE